MLGDKSVLQNCILCSVPAVEAQNKSNTLNHTHILKTSSPPLPCSLGLFVCLRENILKTAKALVEDTKMLVSGAASGQDKLSQAAQSSAKTITQLTDVVKLGAASIGSDDPETQVKKTLPSFFPCLSFPYSVCLLSVSMEG